VVGKVCEAGTIEESFTHGRGYEFPQFVGRFVKVRVLCLTFSHLGLDEFILLGQLGLLLGLESSGLVFMLDLFSFVSASGKGQGSVGVGFVLEVFDPGLRLWELDNWG
jgi:hypothetical protein